MSIFTDRLNELIEKKDITRNKLLTKLELNKSAIYTWEQRGSVPKHETLVKIADYFDVSVDYLLGNTDNPQPANVIAQDKQPKNIIFQGINIDIEDFKDMTEDDLRILATRALEEIERRKQGK